VVRDSGSCNDDDGMKMVVRGVGEGGQEVVVSVGWQRLGDEDDGDVVVVVVSNGGGCGGAWCWGSGRSGIDLHFRTRPETRRKSFPAAAMAGAAAGKHGRERERHVCVKFLY
ncbi:hypothetical protein Tco_1433433, partial [Tanacetum coccineum]